MVGEHGDTDLVLAMPRRELFAVSGFVTRIEMRVIESVAEESWYAVPSMIHADLEAKEVRIGLLVEAGDRLLLADDGVLLHVAAIPPDTEQFGPGLYGVRELARAAARTLLADGRPGIELFGYFNDDALPEAREFFVLVYRVRAAGDTPPPHGMQWVDRAGIGEVPLDAVSSVVAAAWGAG